MATSVSASAVIPLPLLEVWDAVRDFLFPARLLQSIIESAVLEDGSTSSHVGVTRRMTWKTGEVRRHRLLELSDQYNVLRWELIEAIPEPEASATISTLRCRRVTESNHTLVEWSAEYSADVPPELLKFEQRAFDANLKEIRARLTGSPLPKLYHLHEAPSARVYWLALELGVPLDVVEIAPPSPLARDLLKRSQDTELSTDKGGVVTSYVDGDLVLLESGAVVSHMLERHDRQGRLVPPMGTRARADYHKFFFYSVCTADHLLVESYKHMFVRRTQEGEQCVATNRRQWEEQVSVEFENQLSTHKYICGPAFTACDIMVAWTLYAANLLGWLDGHPVLQAYLNVVSARPAFQRVFNSSS
eukprot:TRINITY_DN27964_c0_g1_i1.p1 TRINITY_DN27964_c0_g1~~TRINITY_DN27964_c0_g1_i1.p1  ORF type:complete len:379 (-),score=115.75 TRINITY_DN27964_c0_g1_i1:407-1486(-)